MRKRGPPAVQGSRKRRAAASPNRPSVPAAAFSPAEWQPSGQSGRCLRQFRASLADPELELSRQEIVGNGQFSDLGMQIAHRVLSKLARFEDACRPLQQRPLPLMDHRRMHAVIGGQFRHRALSLHGLQRHPRPERRVVAYAFRHVPISSCLETSRRQIVASVTIRFSGGSSGCSTTTPAG